MAELDLEDRYRNFIIHTITNVIPNVEIFIYGSRTQGKARKYSDVDVALKSETEIPFENILKLKALFSESTFPYFVDIVDLRTVKEYFYNIIKDDLYKIN